MERLKRCYASRVDHAGNRQFLLRSDEINRRRPEVFQSEFHAVHAVSINTPRFFFQIILDNFFPNNLDNDYSPATIALWCFFPAYFFQVKPKGQSVAKERSHFFNLIRNLIRCAFLEALFILLSWGLGKLSTILGNDGSQLFKVVCLRLSDFTLIIGTGLVVIFVIWSAQQFIVELFKGNEDET